MDWLKAAQQLRHDGQPGVLVTVIEVRGQAPREAGAKMVVSRTAAGAAWAAATWRPRPSPGPGS